MVAPVVGEVALVAMVRVVPGTAIEADAVVLVVDDAAAAAVEEWEAVAEDEPADVGEGDAFWMTEWARKAAKKLYRKGRLVGMVMRR